MLLQMMAALFLDFYVMRKIVQVILKIVTHNHALHGMYIANDFVAMIESKTCTKSGGLWNKKYAANIQI